MKELLDFKLEKYFPSAMSFVGYFLIFLGVLAIYFFSFIIGPIFLFIGLNIAFAVTGIQINTKARLLRTYYGLFGLRFGKWTSLDDYKYLSILHNRESTSTFSRSNREITTTDLWFDICLLNENHREKLIIKRLKSTEEAVKEVKVLSEAMGFSVVKYNPEVSEATRLRRAKEEKEKKGNQK